MRESVCLEVFDWKYVMLVRSDLESYVFRRFRCGDLCSWFVSMKVSVLLAVFDVEICEPRWFRCGGLCVWKLSIRRSVILVRSDAGVFDVETCRLDIFVMLKGVDVEM